MSNILVTGGNGFLGPHLVDRLRADGADPFVARREEYDLTRQEDAARLSAGWSTAFRAQSRS
jgi:nucleoside-diphosphate-sugar epimerase